MCGIAGTVSFTRGAGDHHVLGQPISCTVHRSEPGSRRSWSARHARITATGVTAVDLVDGLHQSLTVDQAAIGTTVLAGTGTLFNAAELRRQLSARGHSFDGAGCAEVVLRAYQQWGTACAERLRGMFALAIWDAKREQLILVRDRFGIEPLYYTDTGDGFAFDSTPNGLFAGGLVRPVVDQDGLRELFGFTPTPGMSVFKGVREVLPGEIVTYGRDGLARRRYWTISARLHTDDPETTTARVRQILQDSVRRQVAPGVPLCTMLSGGLDSSAISALASHGMPGTPLHTFSLEYTHHLKHFRPDELHDSLDSPYVAQMVAFLGSEHDELRLDASDLVDPAQHLSVVRAMGQPVVGLDMYVAFQRLAQRIGDITAPVLAGDGADELFGGYIWFQDPWYVKTATFPWLGAFHRMEMVSGLVDRTLMKELDVPEYISVRYEEALREVPLTGEEDATERRMRELTYLNLTRYLRIVLDRRDRLGHVGMVQARVPFVDHELVDYVYSVPWAQKNSGGQEKYLLRAAVRELLPGSILQRKKSPFPTTQDPVYRLGVRARLQAIVESGSPVVDLLDPARVRSVLTDPSFGLSTGVNRMSIEMALQLHHWIADCGVTLDV
ncbi:asparagine synthase (glutamine-hydrolyzing) [Micromonospora sp. WMMD1155]|uniref:asparagine synthase (glutamine-hydrolyzing) n=1 Tax=Micromonospora sp. WMMD1155 TaxID=3016094 RepID=UPI00249B2C49|nr:asparagine synthase (glutamine-hydrolyzing) [Micromonospora sp. WMMD1155]WFE54844.1 asparagine synthase (glutamine-hydrolyzing) [Micromonospora sp. WMMD1155]